MSDESEDKRSKKTKVTRRLGQGITVFRDPHHAEIDIIAIPGLGTNPQECWTWSENAGRPEAAIPGSKARQFNWIRDDDGLAKLFPKARIMLYDYASAWQGKHKVRATMKSICNWLLDDLKDHRKSGGEITRPLIFIGHSMGGIVVAKTLCMARAKKEYEALVTCTMGCALFGAPFRGSDMAKIALLYSSVFGSEAYESLLSFMKTEKNDVLEETTEDFIEISSKLVPPIELFCAWEMEETAVSYAGKVTSNLPGLLQHKFFKAGAKRVMEVGLSAFGTGTFFVDPQSASLPGAHSVGLNADHANLIRFESVDGKEFNAVRIALDRMIKMARVGVRRRTMAFGQKLLTQKFINQVRLSLEGVDMRHKFRARIKQRKIASWLLSERIYIDWMTIGDGNKERASFLWLKGGPGLGKTNACLSAIQEIDHVVADQHVDVTASHSETFLAYFMCEESSGCCTAEDILKSIITQLINEEESLAQHAKWFVPTPRYRGPSTEIGFDFQDSGAQATATVDNLWKCLQDIMEDPIVSSIHVIISNIHFLEVSESTIALLSKLRHHAFALQNLELASRRVRWMLTSRDDRHISEHFTAQGIAIIDMESQDFGSKIRGDRQKYAKDAVLQLRSSKKYSPDLAYYIRNSLESRSEDEKWIDVLCKLLAAMPPDSSDLAIRKRLREIGLYNIHQMVEDAWNTILTRDEGARLELEELLQAVTICYEPPTLADLAVLTQIDDIERLEDLVAGCSPLLRRGDWNEHKDRIVFGSVQFQENLAMLCHEESGLKKRFHGLMALRCFKHIKSAYDPAVSTGAGKASSSLQRTLTTTARLSEDNKVMEVVNEDEDMEDGPRTETQPSDESCFYPVKYLFRHLSEAPPDAAQELYEDDPNFWGLHSDLRNGWLKDFKALTTDLRDLHVVGMSALHVAAGIGAKEVVSTLLSRNGDAALQWINEAGMTALHVAAYNNHADVVETLIRARANIEAGDGNVGTALHFAALRGHCNVMSKLIERKAYVNAISEKYGPVINAAILSGTVDAVKQIMNGNVRFDFDYTKFESPISLAAGISEPSLFQDILETGREKWLRNVKLLDQALIRASYGGRLESLRILLNFQHVYTNNTIGDAILSAAQEKNWSSVSALLDYTINDADREDHTEIELGVPFYLACVAREERMDVLEKIWTFTRQNVNPDILNFSLYESAILKKNVTAIWLLETCGASANTNADRPNSLEHINVGPTADFGNPLNAAASMGNIELLKALLERNAQIDGPRGYSLQLAASEGHTDIVEFLLAHGAEVNKEAEDDQELKFYSVTALQAACDHDREAVVEVLLKHGADPNLGGGVLTNPITAATQRAEPGILKLLLKAEGIRVNVTGGSDKSTPLINAATHMPTECVELLLDHNADINAKNTAGDTALIMAALKGNATCVRVLCQQGADVTHQSPRYGLAIQAAAQGSSPQSAQVLAQNMGGAIEEFREKVKFDHLQAKKDFENAKANLLDRDHIIEGLKRDIEEANDRLDTANKQIEEHKLERDGLVSERLLQGTTYQSVDQQIRAIKFERDELQKQLDAEKGQYKIMQATAADLRKRLEDERARVAQLRTKEGWTALEEKKTAIVALEAEKQVLLEKSSADEEEREKEREQFTTQISNLQEQLLAMENNANTTHTNAMNLLKALKAEKADAKRLALEVERLEKERDDMETTMATVKAAADALSGKQTAASASQEVRSPMSRAGSAVDDEPPTNPSGNPPPSAANGFIRGPSDGYPSPGNFPSGDHGLASSPPLSQDKMSPGPEGFRTIHGHHRPDGALGSYSQGGGTRKKIAADDSSSRNGGGSNSTSSEKDYPQGLGTTFEDFRNNGNHNSNELGHMPTEIVQGTAWRGVQRWSRGVPRKVSGMIDGIGRSSEAKSPPLPKRP